MSRIVLLSLVFPPDNVSTARMMADLAVDLRGLGNEVVVLTTVPHYNPDQESARQQPLRWFIPGIVKRSEYQGIQVFHAWTPGKGASILARAAAWMGFHAITFVIGIFLGRKDVVFAPSPPLTIGVAGRLLSWALGARFIYNVQELYPEIAIRLGAIRNPLLIGVLRWVERWVYRRSDSLTVIGQKMKEQIVAKGIAESKVRVIPNFADIETMTPLPKDNDFSRQHDLYDKFVVSYAGNLGPAQDLETLLRAAAELRNHPSIRFFIAGTGTARSSLAAMIEENGLSNVLLLDSQPYSLVPQIYASSDINLVPLARNTAFEASPSKVYRIMACARPILACADRESDLARTVIEAGCGEVIEPGSPQAITAAILRAFEDQKMWRAMGEAGRKFVTDHFARETISLRYHELIRELTSVPR